MNRRFELAVFASIGVIVGALLFSMFNGGFDLRPALFMISVVLLTAALMPNDEGDDK